MSHISVSMSLITPLSSRNCNSFCFVMNSSAVSDVTPQYRECLPHRWQFIHKLHIIAQYAVGECSQRKPKLSKVWLSFLAIPDYILRNECNEQTQSQSSWREIVRGKNKHDHKNMIPTRPSMAQKQWCNTRKRSVI